MEAKKKFYFNLNKKISFAKRFGKIIIVLTFMFIYSLVNSIQDYEPTIIPDRVVESLYFKGKKISKISYDELDNEDSEKHKHNKQSYKDDEIYYDKRNLSNYAKSANSQKDNLFDYYYSLREDDKESKEKHLYKAYPVNFFYEGNDDEENNKDEGETTSKYTLLSSKNPRFDLNKINSYDIIGKDIYIEVINENINKFYEDQDFEENLNEFNLKNIYGNHTNLKIKNLDLESLVKNNIISNNQAHKFWEELVKINRKKFNVDFVKKVSGLIKRIFYGFFFEKFYKENKIKPVNNYRYKSVNEADMINQNSNHNNNNFNLYKYIFSDENSQDENDVYIFNILPTKSTGCFIFACIVFIINYNLINLYNNKEKISPFLNLALVIFDLTLTEVFYSWKIYFTSNIFLIQFIYNLKYFIFSIIILLGYSTEDFDIFSEFPKCEDTTQTVLQIFTLLFCTLFLGLFSFFRYKYLANYIFFYYCMLQIPYILSINFSTHIPSLFQPFRYFLVIIMGLINFFYINFGKNKIYYTNDPKNELYADVEIDSFYFIGDFFSIFCFTYVFDYLFIQSNKISILFQESEQGGFLNKEKLNEKISKIIKNYKELIREFSMDDSLWTICFAIGIFFQYTGLKYHKYIIYYLSYYFFRMILGVFGRIFNIKCIKITYSILIFIVLITNFLMSSREDKKLFEALKLTNSDLTNILRIFCRFAGVINIIALILLNHEYITIEIYNTFFKKEISSRPEVEDEDEDHSETDYSELLNDENFDKFIKECKLKFKNNMKNFYQMLLNNNENPQGELTEDNELDENKYFPEEIDELLEERIKYKYFKNLAKFIIDNKLGKKKRKSLKDFKNFFDDDEENEEEEDDDDKNSTGDNENEEYKEISIEEEVPIEYNLENFIKISLNAIYFYIDILFTYFTVCLLILFIDHLEQNVFILFSYYALLIIILKKLLVVTHDKPYTIEYLVKFLITYLISLRLQYLTSSSEFPYILTCYYIFFLVNTYSFNLKRKYYLTIVLIFLNYITIFVINSLFSFILMIILIFVPLITSNNRFIKILISSLIYLIPYLIVFLSEKLEKKAFFDKHVEKILMKVNYFNEHYLTLMGFNLIKFLQDKLFNENNYEFHILRELLDYLIKINY